MSNGSYPSSSARHPSRLRATHDSHGSQGFQDVEQTLQKLGLLGPEHRKTPSKPSKPQPKTKPKTVEFYSPVAQHSFRPNSRGSHASSGALKTFAHHNLRSNPTLDSAAPPRSGRGMAGVLDSERSRTRRERTFIGSECAVCEEPLEHTLRGERILQLSCGHVSHEACFYEYIRELDDHHCPTCNAALGLDTSRGGSVLDLEKLSTIVRSVQNDSSQGGSHRSNQNTPPPWDNHPVPDNRSYSNGAEARPYSNSAEARPYTSSAEARPYTSNATEARANTTTENRHYSNTTENRSYSNASETPYNNNTAENNRTYRNTAESRPYRNTVESRPRGDSDVSGRYQSPHPPRQGDSSQSRDRLSERMGSINRKHLRNDSDGTGLTGTTGATGTTGTTGVASSGDYAATNDGRRHDYDLQAMESSLSSPRSLLKRPIPAPTVTVRSEFPTLSRARHQQSLTCLVTVEVVDGNWRPDPDDIRGAPPLPSIASASVAGSFKRPKSPTRGRPVETPYQTTDELDEITEDLHARVDNWHGLDFSRFGKLRLHGHVRVGKDRQSWQELECYLFSEMLICVKEKKAPPQQYNASSESVSRKPKCTLKGSILIKKHLNQVEHFPEDAVLTLSLSVAELPAFHLQFRDRSQLELWRRALMDIRMDFPHPSGRRQEYEQDNSGTEDDDYQSRPQRVSSVNSSAYGPARSNVTVATEYTNSRAGMPEPRPTSTIHVPLDIVVVIPVSSSMQGLKINLLRDTLKFLVQNLGERDRMGLVTFGSSGGGVPIVGMTSKAWKDWPKVLDSIRPVGQKSMRADVVEGANVAMDLLMQRKSNNPISSILLISDSSTSDAESVDFVVSRAEAAKVAIHSFGLGLTHKPDTMIELSTRTKASYTYVKDWMMLRECVAGCLGSLQSISHQNVKLKLRLPEGSPAKFVKISGALQITKRATGRDAEASLGDLRFGDKRDILVQLVIAPDTSSPEQLPQDPWETIVSGLEALGGPLDQDESRTLSVEEVPLIQADLTYGDILREGSVSHLPRPSLLAITILPGISKKTLSSRPSTPPIPPHPHIVQRRMELLTSDMLTRALTLVSRGQHERAHQLLKETRSILKGLGKGGLPPLPPPGPRRTDPPSGPNSTGHSSPTVDNGDRPRTPSPNTNLSLFTPAAGIDVSTMHALDAELESSLEWIHHPVPFGRDSRKAVLQAIGVISSQRAYTFRTPSESLWADRIAGIKRMSEQARLWRETSDNQALMEEN